MKAKVLVGQITNVQPHPDNDALNNKLDIITISGKTNLANRPSPELSRYKVGDYAAMLTENLILPTWLLQYLGLWDEKKNKGMLAGKEGNRLKPRAMGLTTKIVSEVALIPVYWFRYPNVVPDDGSIVQEGLLAFNRELLDDWPTNDIERTSMRFISRKIENEVVTIARINFMIPIVAPTVTTTNDLLPGFSPEGEDVAWNLGVEEEYETII